MKKTITSLALCLLAIVAQAQTPQQMLDKAVSALRSAGTIAATYQVKATQGVFAGNIVMAGSKYRIISKDMKCWYDGTTQWTWSSATDEVNITTPTPEDLQMTNPIAAANDLKTNFNMWKARGQIPGHYAIMMRPNQKSNIEQVYLYINTLTNYKTHQNLPATTFTFDKSMVPAGTPVIDLR